MTYEISRKNLLDALYIAASKDGLGITTADELVYAIERHLHENGKLKVLGAY